MLVDDELLTRTDDAWVASSDLSDLPVPSTINALLAARLDGLPSDEWAIVTAASVEGTVFHRGAVSELTPVLFEPALDRILMALVRRDVIRPDFADFAGEEAYRFRHTLIRDAAYGSLSKVTRADLHERYANWLERAAGDRLREFEEIVGYHLEEAYHFRVAVESIDAHAASLATRSARRLESAGRRALGRSDLPAAIGLLERASDLLVLDEPRRAALLPELGAALIEAGRLAAAERVLGEAGQLAATAGDERAEAHVLVQQQLLRVLRAAEGGAEEAAGAMERVVQVFERCDDDLGLSRARRLQALLHWNEAHAAAAAEEWEQAAEHARRAGDDHARDEILTWIASSLWVGPTPVTEGIRRCEEMRGEVSESPESEAAILRHLAGLHAMDGRFELARGLLATSNATYEDLGLTLNAATSQNEAAVELLAGNPAAAEQSLREGYRALEGMGERLFLPTTAAFLARAILEQGRDEEADQFVELSARLAASGDILTHVLWRGVRARILARRSEAAEAEAVAREAVALAQETDFVNHRADALLDLAEVLEGSRRREEAFAAVSEALRLYELKENTVATSTARSRLAELNGV